MSDEPNPYAPPQAIADSASAPDDAGIEDGDLDAALEGRRPLDLYTVFSDAWRLVYGMKLGVAAASLVLGAIIVPIALLMFGAMFTYADISLDAMADPTQVEAAMAELTGDVVYMLMIGLIAVPMNALTYMSVTNIGLRRAAGHTIRIRDAFPLRGLLRGMAVMLMLWPLGLVATIHPLAGYLTTPIYFCLFWVPALLLDREDMSIPQAMVTSVRLVRHTWIFILVSFVAFFSAYMATACTLGIAMFWLLPWGCNVYGVGWRRLAGLKSERLRAP